ncbi:DUF3570 domain-containing protein [Mucilaginibacter sp.]|jgi:hypothetical protein|uniref:DUF3570 domain-containing protein n=1 Tax=Mucilaginibacter sp. TaxID=1882438 RepID=UPI002CE8BE11|nr:DUF3570 domain-containing protein [Mucilaginibacter sp.]HTI59945.1 DUF3570 domain-containing protein [Mucilaginibacter sp.]
MRKVYLSVLGFALVCRLNVHAQTIQDTLSRTKAPSLYTPVEQPSGSAYNPQALHVDEVNLVSSYYLQNGNHSAVTGGIGTEHVTDISNGIDLKLLWGDPKVLTNSITLGLGIDHHTSASSAYVNLSGASKQGGSRVYPSIDWTKENIKKGSSFGLGAYYSGEYNYKSLGADLHFSQKTTDRMGEFGAKIQAYFDHVTLIYPSEFIPTSTTTEDVIVTNASTSGGHGDRPKIPTSPRNTFTASLSYSQIINSRMQIMFLVDGVTQNGYLSLPFHRVYFNTGKDTIERLPSTRFKLPVGFRLNYFVGDNIIVRTYYRYYLDSWGIRSNTAYAEVPVKITPFLSVSPFYRYYNQSAAKYFAPYGVHDQTDEYYTSNYEYARFTSNFFGVGLRVAPPKGVFGWQNLHDLELRYGHYSQNTNLVSDVVSLSLSFK